MSKVGIPKSNFNVYAFETEEEFIQFENSTRCLRSSRRSKVQMSNDSDIQENNTSKVNMVPLPPTGQVLHSSVKSDQM